MKLVNGRTKIKREEIGESQKTRNSNRKNRDEEQIKKYLVNCDRYLETQKLNDLCRFRSFKKLLGNFFEIFLNYIKRQTYTKVNKQLTHLNNSIIAS